MTNNNQLPNNESKAAGNKLPDQFKDENIGKTKVTTLKKMVEDTLIKLEDLATLEVMLPSAVRMRKRMESIQKMGAAQHLKINGHWKTSPPKMHIKGLAGVKHNNDECTIKFSVYESDKNGDKKVKIHSTPIVREDGTSFNRETSAEYRIAYEVTESIKTGKAISREIVNIEVQ